MGGWGWGSDCSRSLSLGDAALKVGADVDRQLFRRDVAFQMGGGHQLDLLALDAAQNTTPHLDGVGGDASLDLAGLTNDQMGDADIALHLAVDLEIAGAGDLTLEHQVG